MKAPLKKGQVRPFDGGEDEAATTATPVAATVDTAVETIEVETLPDAPKAERGQVIAGDARVDVVFTKALDTYPVVGKFNFQTEFAISEVKANQRFTIPYHVAIVLQEKGWVILP